MSTIEDYISDLTARAISISGDIYGKNFTQVIRDPDDGTDVEVGHTFYSITDVGTIKKLGGISFTESGGVVGMNFDVVDSSGDSSSVLSIGADGLSVQGGFDVSGGSTNFETSTINVADFDIVLGSGATELSQLDGGGMIVGTVESGEISLLYSFTNDFWNTNTGVNVETGHGFTVNTDSVILNESGLKIDDILLSQTGLEIGTDVSISSTAITLGTTNPVILNASGLAVGSDLSLDTTNGLQAGDITLNNTVGLLIGTGTSALVLDSTGLFVGSEIELSVASGLTLGDTNLADSLTFTNATTGDVIVNDDGIQIGPDISITKSGGLALGPDATISTTSISFGVSPDETVIDDTSVQLGTDALLNHDGLYFGNEDAAIYMGGSNEWKVSVDTVTKHLTFQFYDTLSGTYITKTEIKST